MNDHSFDSNKSNSELDIMVATNFSHKKSQSMSNTFSKAALAITTLLVALGNGVYPFKTLAHKVDTACLKTGPFEDAYTKNYPAQLFPRQIVLIAIGKFRKNKTVLQIVFASPIF